MSIASFPPSQVSQNKPVYRGRLFLSESNYPGMLLFPKLHCYPFCFVRTYQNNNCSNYCYYYYYNDSNEARSQRLHGKLWWYFINIVNCCLLKLQHFIINTDIESIMKDRVTFYLRIEKERLASSHCSSDSSRHCHNSSCFSQYPVKTMECKIHI